MKKLFYLFLATTLFSCDRELEYGSDFDFEVINMIGTPVYINSLKPFQLEITDKISIENNSNYILSYRVISGDFYLKKGTETLIEENNYNITFNELDLLELSIMALSDNEIKIEFVLKDNNGVEKSKQILINPEPLSVPFTLTKVGDFTLKSTKQVAFQFTLTGVITTNTYEIKFISNNICKIFKTSGEEIIREEWVPISLNTNSLYTYEYNALSNANDVLEVQIKDNFGQIKTISYSITILSKPIINNYNIQFTRTTPTAIGSQWLCSGETKSNITKTISGGATLIKTRIIIKNKLTNLIETLEFSNSNDNNILETINSRNTTSSAGAYANVLTNSKYAGQMYSIQIMDSDNVWSDLYNGTVINL